jgi:DNA mismatch endonuclease, patch repair protein
MWADISFPRQRVAVFIDGCFWHGCPAHCQPSKSNVRYWRHKLDRNRARDAEMTLLLRSLGWTVLRFWEHEATDLVARKIVKRIRGGRALIDRRSTR